jgi:hypothetical protein
MVVFPAASRPTCTLLANHVLEEVVPGQVTAVRLTRPTHHENTHLLLGEQPRKQLGER